MISTELFPYENFGVRLEIKKEDRIAWFQDEYYLQKYLTRSKLKEKDIKVIYRDEQPPRISKTNKKNLQQTVEKDNHRSGGGHRRNTKNLDTTGNTHRTRKSKK